MRNMKSNIEIALQILEALENQTTNLRVTRGYGPAHPHFGGDSPRTLGNRTNLGNSPHEPVDEEEPDTVEDPKKVKISRVFEEYE